MRAWWRCCWAWPGGALSSRAGARKELEALQGHTAQLREWVTFFTKGRTQLVKDRPDLAYLYFPYPEDPKVSRRPRAAPAQKKRRH